MTENSELLTEMKNHQETIKALMKALGIINVFIEDKGADKLPIACQNDIIELVDIIKRFRKPDVEEIIKPEGLVLPDGRLL